MYAPTYGVNLTPDFPIVSLYQHHSPGGEMRLETFIITTTYILLLPTAI